MAVLSEAMPIVPYLAAVDKQKNKDNYSRFDVFKFCKDVFLDQTGNTWSWRLPNKWEVCNGRVPRDMAVQNVRDYT